MPRLSRKYSKPDFIFRALTKGLFKIYQLVHHDMKWDTCPGSIVNKIENVISNIQIPKVELSKDFIDGPFISYVEKYHYIRYLPQTASSLFMDITKHYESELSKHFRDYMDDISKSVLLDMEFKISRKIHMVPSSKVLSALIVVKRWIRRNFRTVNLEIMDYLLSKLNRYDHLEFEYKNDRFVDNSSSPPISSEEESENENSEPEAETESTISDPCASDLPTSEPPNRLVSSPPSASKSKRSPVKSCHRETSAKTPEQNFQPPPHNLHDSGFTSASKDSTSYRRLADIPDLFKFDSDDFSDG